MFAQRKRQGTTSSRLSTPVAVFAQSKLGQYGLIICAAHLQTAFSKAGSIGETAYLFETKNSTNTHQVRGQRYPPSQMHRRSVRRQRVGVTAAKKNHKKDICQRVSSKQRRLTDAQIDYKNLNQCRICDLTMANHDL